MNGRIKELNWEVDDSVWPWGDNLALRNIGGNSMITCAYF